MQVVRPGPSKLPINSIEKLSQDSKKIEKTRLKTRQTRQSS